jgi:hypothetical protein
VTRVGILLIMTALVAGMVGCDSSGQPHSQNLEIQTWYDLDAVRNNLAGHHILINDLDSATAGYEELASPIANKGKGWQPIGTFLYCTVQQSFGEKFEGTFDGQGYEIRDLYINRLGESSIGLFGFVVEGGIIKNVSVINATVASGDGVDGPAGLSAGTVRSLIGYLPPGADVGGLVGLNDGTVSNCHVMGGVTGNERVGGLVGSSAGTVSNSYSTGSVSGNSSVGGLVGDNGGTVSNSYSTGSVSGNSAVGGLVGWNEGTVSNSYSTGSVTGGVNVGGLVGRDYDGNVSDSFWDVETSGQATSAAGTGKPTAEMKNTATFSGAAWNIVAVANTGERNPSYTWNIIDDETYPFLSWQP